MNALLEQKIWRLFCVLLACVAVARKGRGIGEIGRARGRGQRTGRGESPFPFPLLAPAAQATCGVCVAPVAFLNENFIRVDLLLMPF